MASKEDIKKAALSLFEDIKKRLEAYATLFEEDEWKDGIIGMGKEYEPEKLFRLAKDMTHSLNDFAQGIHEVLEMA